MTDAQLLYREALDRSDTLVDLLSALALGTLEPTPEVRWSCTPLALCVHRAVELAGAS